MIKFYDRGILVRKIVNKYNLLPIQIKASLWFLVCGFLSKGVSFITTPIFTRLLTAEEYGQYSVFNSWYGIIAVFVTFNLYSGVYAQGIVKFEKERKQITSSLQGLCLTLTVIWTIIYLLFQKMWNKLFELTTIQMLALLILCWTSAVFQFWSIEQRVDLKYHMLVAVTFFVSIIKPVLGIFLVLYADDKVTARILGLVFVELMAYTGLFIKQIYSGKIFFSKFFWSYAIRFNLPLIPHYLSMTVLNSADRIMISSLVGDREAGIYNLAYSVSQIMIVFNTAFQQTMEPWLYKKIKERKISDIQIIVTSTLIIISIVNIALITIAPEVIKIFAPVAYYDAINIIPPITMSVYFMFLYNFFAVFEFYYEKTKYIMVSTTLSAILNVVLNYLFISVYGYYAAGYTTLVCYIVYAISHFFFMKKIFNKYIKIPQPYNVKIILNITVVFMGVSFLFYSTYRHFVLRVGLIIICLIVIFFCRKLIIECLNRVIKIREKVN